MGRRPHKHPDAAAGGSTRQKDEILKTIVEKMAAGTWMPFRSVRQLCLSHNMTLHNAQKYVAEASRLIRLSWGGEEAKAMVLERIQQIGLAAEFRTEEAITGSGEVVQLRRPDFRTALKAHEDLAVITGLMGPTADVVIRFQQMSDGELWAEAERFGRELTQGKTIHVTTGETIEAPPSDGDGGPTEAEDAALHRLITQPTR